MNKNPFLNALMAVGYICVVVSVIFYGGEYAGDAPETLLIPVAMLSLFVFSAAVMGYLFLLQPATLYLDGKKQEGIHFFLTTVAVFGGVVLLLFLILFFMIPALY